LIVIGYIEKNEPPLYKNLHRKVKKHYVPNTVEERTLLLY